MVIKLIVLTGFLATVIALPLPQDRGWHGIRPLHTTRSEVEKLIGGPMQPNSITYDLKDERVNITYSTLPCAKGWPYGWNVPSDTVISIVTYPKTKRVLSELQVDLNKFKRIDRPENQRVTYYNDDEGITIQTEANQQIASIEYLPSNSDSYLRCPEAAAREESIQKGQSASVAPVLYYHDIPQPEQRVRLDYFADKFKEKSPNSMIYIIGYADAKECVDQSRKRSSWAKEYLVRSRKISASRIKILEGGLRDDVWVELFIVARGGPTPLPSPNVYPKNVQGKSDCGSHRHKNQKPIS